MKHFTTAEVECISAEVRNYIASTIARLLAAHHGSLTVHAIDADTWHIHAKSSPTPIVLSTRLDENHIWDAVELLDTSVDEYIKDYDMYTGSSVIPDAILAEFAAHPHLHGAGGVFRELCEQLHVKAEGGVRTSIEGMSNTHESELSEAHPSLALEGYLFIARADQTLAVALNISYHHTPPTGTHINESKDEAAKAKAAYWSKLNRTLRLAVLEPLALRMQMDSAITMPSRTLLHLDPDNARLDATIAFKDDNGSSLTRFTLTVDSLSVLDMTDRMPKGRSIPEGVLVEDPSVDGDMWNMFVKVAKGLLAFDGDIEVVTYQIRKHQKYDIESDYDPNAKECQFIEGGLRGYIVIRGMTMEAIRPPTISTPLKAAYLRFTLETGRA